MKRVVNQRCVQRTKPSAMNAYLETGLSLVFIIFIFSIIAYILQEILAVNLQYRGRLLWRSIAQLLDGIQVKGRDLGKKRNVAGGHLNTDALFNHPQIKTLAKEPDKLPSYIPSANFALAVMDLVGKKVPEDKKTASLFNNIQLALQDMPEDKEAIFVVLENLVATSAGSKELQQKIEDWFNDYMTRVTGWYKSNTVVTVRLIALGVTLFFNINVVSISKEIFRNAQLRGVLSNAAMDVAANRQLLQKNVNDSRAASLDSTNAIYERLLQHAPTRQDSLLITQQRSAALSAALQDYNRNALAAADSLYQQLADTQLPLGWNADILKKLFVGAPPSAAGHTLVRIFWALVGWLIAAGCISMGAPFWFDVMVKLVNVRRAGLVPDGKKT